MRLKVTNKTREASPSWRPLCRQLALAMPTKLTTYEVLRLARSTFKCGETLARNILAAADDNELVWDGKFWRPVYGARSKPPVHPETDADRVPRVVRHALG